MNDHLHIVATWPKTRPLEAYLTELERADRNGEVINFRVGYRPRWKGSNVAPEDARCYMVHDGFIRGYTMMHGSLYRYGSGEVYDPHTDGYLPAGSFIVRSPVWHPIEPIPMRGFQGWRWFEDEA